MSKATITHSTHTLAAEAFIKEFDNSEEPVYAFAGRGFPWEIKNNKENVPEVFNSERTRIDALRNMLYAKKLSSKDCHLVIKRYDWKPDVVYMAWNPNENVLYPSSWENENETYGSPVVTVYNRQENEYNVYLCINNNNKKPSTISPDNSSGNALFKNQYQYQTYDSDGYTWKWLFTVKNNIIEDYQNNEFLLFPTEDEYTEDQKLLMEQIKTTDELNQIYSIDVIDNHEYHILSETNYNTVEWNKLITPTVTGDGNSAKVEIQITKLDEKITKVYAGAEREYFKYRIDRINLTNYGNSYTYADLEYELGSTTDILVEKPTLHIVIDKSLSITKSMSYFIGVRHVCVKAEFISNEINDNFKYFPVDFTYRQIGLVKNLRNRLGYKIKTDDNISFYDIIYANNVSTNFEKDTTIHGVLSGAFSTVLYTTKENSAALEQTLYVTNTSGAYNLEENEYIETLRYKENSSDVDLYASGNILSYKQADVSTKFGDLIYIQNTLPISRRESQKEVFLFVIEL